MAGLKTSRFTARQYRPCFMADVSCRSYNFSSKITRVTWHLGKSLLQSRKL